MAQLPGPPRRALACLLSAQPLSGVMPVGSTCPRAFRLLLLLLFKQKRKIVGILRHVANLSRFNVADTNAEVKSGRLSSGAVGKLDTPYVVNRYQRPGGADLSCPGACEGTKPNRASLVCLFNILFIHVRHTERDGGRERSRRHAGSPTWDSIPGPQDDALGQRRR